MATNVMTGQDQATIEHDFSWVQKYILRCFHPRSLFVDVVSIVILLNKVKTKKNYDSMDGIILER